MTKLNKQRNKVAVLAAGLLKKGGSHGGSIKAKNKRARINAKQKLKSGDYYT